MNNFMVRQTEGCVTIEGCRMDNSMVRQTEGCVTIEGCRMDNSMVEVFYQRSQLF